MDITYNIVDDKQLKRTQLELGLLWLLYKAVHDEISNKCADAYTEIKEADVPKDAKVLDSHKIYKIKLEEHGKRLKARLFPHGNNDQEKWNQKRLFNRSVRRYSLDCIDDCLLQSFHRPS